MEPLIVAGDEPVEPRPLPPRGVPVSGDELKKILAAVRRQIGRPLPEPTDHDRARLAAAQAKRDRRATRNKENHR